MGWTYAPRLLAACLLSAELTLCAPLFVLGQPSTAPDVNKDLDRAVQLRKQEKYDEAISLLRTGLALKPDTDRGAALLFELGQVLFLKGQAPLTQSQDLDTRTLEEALATFRRVQKQYPNSGKAAPASYMVGSTYLVMWDSNQALKSYQATYADFPKYTGRSRALLRSGILMGGLDRTAEGREIMKRVVREYPASKFPDSKTDVQSALKHLRFTEIHGQLAAPLRADSWLNQNIDRAGPLQNLQGEVLVLVFLSTGCTSCSRQLPKVRYLINTWTERGVFFLGLFNPLDRRSTMTPNLYVEKARLDLFDVGLVTNSNTWEAYRADRLPGIVVVDRQGKIRWRGHPTYFPAALLAKVLEE